jgi:hypothetical protein
VRVIQRKPFTTEGTEDTEKFKKAMRSSLCPLCL